jgi:uncharacterized protein YndB with AHSA1/START domain
MSVIDVRKDLDACKLTIVAEYEATVDRMWRLWADPRQLERWWGPPTYPATVTRFEFAAGGTVNYHMTGPDGDEYHGGWHVIRVDAPHLIELEDFFANNDGTENTDLPRSSTVVSIAQSTGGATMTIETTYPSTEALQQVLDMGTEEGIMLALGQIDDLLAEQPV